MSKSQLKRINQQRMTPEEYRLHQQQIGREQMRTEALLVVKPSKHGNKKVYVDGVKVADSGREHKRLLELRLLESQGVISKLQCQEVFELVRSVTINGRQKPPIRYIADFTYFRDGTTVIEDAKSPHLRKDPVYRIKKHLMMATYGREIIEV